MQDRYLEVTFRKGKPLAAYLYLAREIGIRSVRTQVIEKGLMIDYATDGKPIGLEITSPRHINFKNINEFMEQHGLSPIAMEEIAPLRAA
jgi:hypothetical protein